MGRHQTGHIFESASGAFHVRYYTTEIVDGKARRVQRSHLLAHKDNKHYSTTCKAVKLLRDEFMRKVNTTTQPSTQDMRIVDFWDSRYLPYCEETVQLTGQPRKKPSTVRGYKQIWHQHLRAHFGEMTLQQYEPDMGTQFLESLTSTQGKTTLKHIRALGSSIFTRAVKDRRLKVNPWHDVVMPDDAIEPETTPHYTLEEAEDIISALVDHVDAQLVVALSFFVGLRPSEIAGLRWEDFDIKAESESAVHIRRAVVNGIVGTPKTPESVATLPLIDQVIVPLQLWRQKSGNLQQGWVFENQNGKPADLKDMVRRIIRPTLTKEGLEWKTLYAGRRGACTATVEATGGNYAVAQALLRHKSMKVTLDVYKKAITPAAFRTGMKALQAAANGHNGNGNHKQLETTEHGDGNI